MALLSQVSTSYPRVPRDFFAPDTGIFSFLLSGYGQFMLSKHPSCLFADVDCCISISVHLIPTRTVINLFRIISALFLSFRIYCIFCLKGKSGLPLLILFPSIQAYIPTYPRNIPYPLSCTLFPKCRHWLIAFISISSTATISYWSAILRLSLCR